MYYCAIVKFHFIWHTNQTTENSKKLFLNKSICNFILQVIRNFTVEYDYELKFKYTLLRAPASPLKFRMIDRVGWSGTINLTELTVTEFEYIMWFDRIVCNREIKNSYINCNKFSENYIRWRTWTMQNIGTRIYGNNSWSLLNTGAKRCFRNLSSN